MTLTRRVVSVVSAVVALTAQGVTPAHALGAPPGYLPPGEYVGSSFFADFNAFVNGTANVNVSVSDATFSNHPKAGFTFPSGGNETVLNISVFDYSTFASFQGCYLISQSDVVPSTDLSTMTLITTIQASTPVCNPFGNNIPAGTTVSLQWLGTGPIATNRDDVHFSCTAYTQETQRTSSSNLALVSGTLPGLIASPLSDVPSFIDSFAGDTHVSGSADASCPPGGNGGGRGAGRGPQPAGNFQFIDNQAFANFQSPDFTEFVEIIASTDTQIANPQAGPVMPTPTPSPVSGARTNASGARTNGGPMTTTTTSVEVRISNFNTFTFESACYLVAPSAFTTNGITSAALHVVLSAQQPCPNSFDQQNVPLPLTVDATWTGTGPSAPTRDSGQFSCASYTSQSLSLSNGVTAASSFTLPELFPNQVFVSSPDSSALTTSDLSVHASGVDPQNCIFRG